METSTYHHGDLRRAIIDAALEAIRESSPAAVSLRDLARRAGVSHAAPAHHFGDKAGLLTAVAAQGFGLLGDVLQKAAGQPDGYLAVGVAYVGFAVEHRAHFEVMFRPELYHADDPELLEAQARTSRMLYEGAAPYAQDGGTTPRDAALAAWSLVHGFASLWLSGNLPADLPADPQDAARRVARVLFPHKAGDNA